MLLVKPIPTRGIEQIGNKRVIASAGMGQTCSWTLYKSYNAEEEEENRGKGLIQQEHHRCLCNIQHKINRSSTT
eukprot:m.36213 g.36213  ORF g.36213 m.36213 type:complete len:74 (-) comp6654_c0_seq3:132-353(-)